MIIRYLQKYGLISSKIIMSFFNMFLRTGGHTAIHMYVTKDAKIHKLNIEIC